MLKYKSTEHNIDVYVAFMKLYEATGDSIWRQRAMSAKTFAKSMWHDADPDGNGSDGAHVFYTGTGTDGVTPNKDNYPLDVMPWGFLALGEANKYGLGLASALTRHGTSETVGGKTYQGFDFNTDKDGIWWEGTAHMATAWWQLCNAYAAQSGACDKARKYQNELRKAQIYAPRHNGNGITATLHDKLTTGFDLPTPADGPWYYYNRLHIGATAWFIFAEQQWNPYWGVSTTSHVPYQGK